MCFEIGVIKIISFFCMYRQHHRHDDNDHKLKCSECGVKFDTTEELS